MTCGIEPIEREDEATIATPRAYVSALIQTTYARRTHQREEGVEDAALEAEALGEAQLVRGGDRLLGGGHHGLCGYCVLGMIE